MTTDTTASSSSSPPTYPIRSITLAYFAAFIGLGLFTSVLGPSLPGLAENTRTSLSEIGVLFTARSLGYLLGSLGLGRVFDRLPGHALLVSVLLVMAVTVAIAPLVPYLWLLALILLALGIGEGTLDIGVNLLLVWVHRRRSGPYLNALHFFFGLGATLSPIFVAQAILHAGGITWAFWGLALYMLPLTTWLARLPSPSPPPVSAEDVQDDGRALLVALISFFFFLYVGAEVSFGGWIYTYVIALELGDVAGAASLTSAFWGALTVGRLLGIPVAVRYSPRTILIADLLGCLLSIGVILLLPSSYPGIWVGTIGIGMFMASIFPITLAFAGRRIAVSGAIMRWFFVGTGAGGMSLPWLSGLLFEVLGPRSVMFAILLDLTLALVVFLYINARASQRPLNSGA